MKEKGEAMKKLTLTLALTVALVAIIASPMDASVPVCELGGATAMDTNRQLAKDESFVVTDRPLVVNLRFRPTKERPEQVGECMLPSGTVVAIKNNILQWVKTCGNDEVNRNIFVIPFQPMKGLNGKDGRDGLPGRNGLDGKNFVPPPPDHGWCGIFRTNKGCNWATGVILVTAAGVVIATQGNDDKPGPVVHTDPPSARVGLTPRVGFIPPRNGHGGGFFVGGSVSFK